MKILLACSSGMSTSLLVNKMKESAKAQNIEVEIWAIGQHDVQTEMEKANVLLFGPQMRFLKSKFSDKANELKIPIDVINMVAYGRCDGKAVLKQAIDLIENN